MRISKPTRWPRPTDFARSISIPYALAALIGAHALAWLLAELLYLAGITVPDADRALLVDLGFLAALLPLMLRGARPRDLGLQRVPGARSAGLVLLALITYILLAFVLESNVRTGPSHSLFARLPFESDAVVVLAGVSAFVTAPVFEELLWRGVLYRALRNRLATAPALLLAAVPFGAVHTQYGWGGRGVVAIFGVIAALLYEYTGSLLPGIALHSLIDGNAFVYAEWGRALIVPGIFLLFALVLTQRDIVRYLMRRAGRTRGTAPAET